MTFIRILVTKHENTGYFTYLCGYFRTKRTTYVLFTFCVILNNIYVSSLKISIIAIFVHEGV
jgi:hypothetical protein